jgi:Spy/CpxP family protein refolding chaperone
MRIGLLMTFLLGSLAASVVLNVMQYRAASADSSPQQGPSPYAELELTQAQVRVLNKYGQMCCDTVEELRAESERVTEELRVALSGPDFDQMRVKELADELCSLRNQEVDNNITTLLQVRDVLKPGQLRELYHLLYPDWEE